MEGFEPFPPLLTVDELAEYLRISRSSAYNLCRLPGFPAVKVCRAIRIPSKKLMAWLDQNEGLNQNAV